MANYHDIKNHHETQIFQREWNKKHPDNKTLILGLCYLETHPQKTLTEQFISQKEWWAAITKIEAKSADCSAQQISGGWHCYLNFCANWARCFGSEPEKAWTFNQFLQSEQEFLTEREKVQPTDLARVEAELNQMLNWIFANSPPDNLSLAIKNSISDWHDEFCSEFAYDSAEDEIDAYEEIEKQKEHIAELQKTMKDLQTKYFTLSQNRAGEHKQFQAKLAHAALIIKDLQAQLTICREQAKSWKNQATANANANQTNLANLTTALQQEKTKQNQLEQELSTLKVELQTAQTNLTRLPATNYWQYGGITALVTLGLGLVWWSKKRYLG